MTLEAFLVEYPEFEGVSYDLVQAKLNASARTVSATAFGDAYDDAHGLWAAHLLWTSEHGSTMRQEGGDQNPTSRYLDAFRALERKKASRWVVT